MAEPQGIEISNEELQLMLEAGTAYYEQNQLGKAKEVFEGVISLAPTLAMPYASLAAIYYLEKNEEQAVAYYEKALHYDPNDKYAACNLGEIMLAQCHNDRALELLKHSAVIDTEGHIHQRSHALLVHNGSIYYDRHDFDKAIDLFQAAAEIAPQDAPTFVRLGTALQAKGNLEQAKKAFEQCLALDDTEGFAHLYLAEILAQQKQKNEAQKHLKRAEELDTDGRLAEQIKRVKDESFS